MINHLLMPAIKEQSVKLDSDEMVLLLVVAICYLVPYFLLHYLDYKRNAWKLVGAPLKLLQANLMRKFMSYTNKVRNSVDHGEIILVLFKDIPHVVTAVFNAIFPLIRDGTMLIALFAYQLIG